MRVDAELIRWALAALREVRGDGSLPDVAVRAAQAPGQDGATVTAQEAAKWLGVSRLTLYGYVRRGLLRAERRGRPYAVSLEDVKRLRAARRRGRQRAAAARKSVARRKVRAARRGQRR